MIKSVYFEDDLEEMQDDDLIDEFEGGFMRGYLTAEVD